MTPPLDPYQPQNKLGSKVVVNTDGRIIVIDNYQAPPVVTYPPVIEIQPDIPS